MCPSLPHLLECPFGITRSDVDAGYGISEKGDVKACCKRIEDR